MSEQRLKEAKVENPSTEFTVVENPDGTGTWFALRLKAPRFCIEAATVKEVEELAQRALEFYKTCPHRNSFEALREERMRNGSTG